MPGCLRWACWARWREMFPILRCCSLCNPAMTIVSRSPWTQVRRYLGIAGSQSQGQADRMARGLRRLSAYEPGVLDICKRSLERLRTARLHSSKKRCRIIRSTRFWRAWLTLRAWQSGGTLLAYYSDPAKRAMIKPEAIFEIESGLNCRPTTLRPPRGAHRMVPGRAAVFSKYDYAVIFRPRNCFRSMSICIGRGNRRPGDGRPITNG